MSIEGEITVRLHWDGQRVRRVGLGSTRPRAAAQVVVGRTPADAATLLPALFSVCSHAQGAAARAALRAAGADVGATGDATAWAVPLEVVQETFWRLLIDLPQALGLAPQVAAVGTTRAVVASAVAALRDAPAAQPVLEGAGRALGALANEHVFGRDGAAWRAEIDLPAFDVWCERGATLPARTLARLRTLAPGLGRSDTALMPAPDDDATGWAGVLDALRSDPGFAQAPTWSGAAVETGALSRQRGHPLVAALIARDGHSAATRIVARLVELAQSLDVIARAGDERWVRAWPLGAGEGLAAVQTARGLLLHQAIVAGGRVRDWRIVAPTEWNFHSEGALARGLAGHEAGDEAVLVAQAGLAVRALDPCVGFRVEVSRDA